MIGPSRFHLFRFPFPLLWPDMGTNKESAKICKLLYIEETIDLRIYEPSLEKKALVRMIE